MNGAGVGDGRTWTLQGPPRIVDLVSRADGRRQRAFEYRLVGSDGTAATAWLVGLATDGRLPGWTIEDPEEVT
jgi:hypothetical protein